MAVKQLCVCVCVWLYCRFTNKSVNEGTVKIGKQLPKLWTKVWSLVFWLRVYFKWQLKSHLFLYAFPSSHSMRIPRTIFGALQKSNVLKWATVTHTYAYISLGLGHDLQQQLQLHLQPPLSGPWAIGYRCSSRHPVCRHSSSCCWCLVRLSRGVSRLDAGGQWEDEKYIHCVSIKNTPDIFHGNSSRHCWILIIFGINAWKERGNRKMVYCLLYTSDAADE